MSFQCSHQVERSVSSWPMIAHCMRLVTQLVVAEHVVERDLVGLRQPGLPRR